MLDRYFGFINVSRDLLMSDLLELLPSDRFARPAIISGQQMKPGQVALMRVMSQLLGEAEVEEVNETFQGCPNLTLGLLRLVNSVATGLRSKIGSLPHALVVLGRRQLLRWVQLLLYAQSAADVPPPLMTMVAVRAKAMELLCERHRDQRIRQQDMRDRAFMTGMLSLVGVAVGMELAEILPPLNLAEDVNRALLEHGGTLGQMLLLVEKIELVDFGAATELLTALDMAPEDLDYAQLGAMRWARSLAQTAV